MKLMCKKKTSVRQQMLFPQICLERFFFSCWCGQRRVCRGNLSMKDCAVVWTPSFICRLTDVWLAAWLKTPEVIWCLSRFIKSVPLPHWETDGRISFSVFGAVCHVTPKQKLGCMPQEQITWCGLFRMETKLGFVQQKLFLKWWRIHWCCFTALIYRRL